MGGGKVTGRETLEEVTYTYTMPMCDPNHKLAYFWTVIITTCSSYTVTPSDSLVSGQEISPEASGRVVSSSLLSLFPLNDSILSSTASLVRQCVRMDSIPFATAHAQWK